MKLRIDMPQRLKLWTAFLIFLVAAAFLVPSAALAQENSKTVRVGWYESSFNSTDKAGRRSGYAYEYQLKIAAYTGWKYDYVTGSWSDLLQMLIDGKIDIMSDVSYTEERSTSMLFPDYPMGSEEYCIFISPNNKQITSEDYTTLNGKRVGMNKGSLQADLFTTWAEKHGITAEVMELTCPEADSLAMLDDGELDAYVTVNAFGEHDNKLVPVCKIGSSDIYFAVSNKRPELLQELNTAMSRIQDEDPYYNQRMFEQYVQSYGSNAFLSAAEESWQIGRAHV